MASASKPHFKVFVAGISSSTSNSEVLKYFRSFGLVAKIDRSFGDSLSTIGDSQDVGARCILGIRDYNTVQRILHHSQHYVGGRRVMCKEYLEGSQLFKQNHNNNKRRVIIKRIPFNIKEKDLHYYLNANFGPIELMFCFMPDSKKEEKISHRQYRSYSVMFKEAFSTLEAIRANFIYFKNGQTAIIEKFVKSKQIARQNWQFLSNKVKSIPLKKLNKKLKVRSFSLQVLNNIVRKNIESNRAFSSDGGKHYDRTGCKRHQFACHLVDSCSSVKPTKKLYCRIRQNDFNYLSSMELKNTWKSQSNLRYNKLEYL